MYWWGVTFGAVSRWRKALGVERMNDGSARLRQELNEEIGASLRGVPLPASMRERMRDAALADGRQPSGRWDEDGWTPEQLALLGTLPDEQVAERTDRTENAVRIMRERLDIANPTSNRWSADEVALLGTLPDSDVAQEIGRLLQAVTQNRIALGIGNPFDGRSADRP